LLVEERERSLNAEGGEEAMVNGERKRSGGPGSEDETCVDRGNLLALWQAKARLGRSLAPPSSAFANRLSDTNAPPSVLFGALFKICQREILREILQDSGASQG
jgi:hypothetical protein